MKFNVKPEPTVSTNRTVNWSITPCLSGNTDGPLINETLRNRKGNAPVAKYPLAGVKSFTPIT